MTWIKLRPLAMCSLLLLQGCGIYSFSGVSLPKEVQTFSLNFQSAVALGPPDLATRLQQRLCDELAQRTSLKQVYEQGDLQLEGSITRFVYTPTALTKGMQENEQDQASIERLTIEVALTYINRYDEDAAFSKKTFAQFADMPATADRNSEESRLIDAIFTELIDDIFNETVASW